MKLLRFTLFCSGWVFVLLLFFAFTPVPKKALYWLSSPEHHLPADVAPQVIVILGGGYVPSPAALMRTYYGAELGKRFPEARVVISLPTPPEKMPEGVGRIQKELVLRGVNSEQISAITTAKNTYQEARETASLLGAADLDLPLALVSSPSHLRRAYNTFRKAGFTTVYTYPARIYLGSSPRSFSELFRYNFWKALEIEIYVLRELVAIGYYRLRYRES